MNSFKKKTLESGWLKIVSDNVNNIYIPIFIFSICLLWVNSQFYFFNNVSIRNFTRISTFNSTSTFSRLGLYKIPRFFNILIKYYYGGKILSNFQIYFLWAPGKYWCMQCAIFYEIFWFHCFGKFNKRWIHFKKYI